MKRFLLALALFFYAAFSYAENYYWVIYNYESLGRFNSPMAACQYRAVWYKNNNPNRVPSVKSLTPTSQTSYTCILDIYIPASGSTTSNTSQIRRYGDSCPDGSTYNSSIGECSAPQPNLCESTIGSNIKIDYDVTADVVTAPPRTACVSSCTYNLNASASVNNGKLTGQCGFSSGRHVCEITYTGTGSECSSSPSSESPIKTPSSSEESSCTPWEDVSQGVKARTCNSVREFSSPGNSNCTSNLETSTLSCVSGTPPAKSVETTVEQDIVETQNPDGSSTTTTTTTTTNTSCVGVNACTTTTTTNVNTSGKNADGSPGQTSNTCTGPGCKNGGDGSNVGDEKGEEEGVERDATVGACGAPIACQGDAIDCAILEKQKEQQCFAEEMSDFDGKKSDIEGLFQGQNYQLDEGSTIDAPSFINQGTRFLPASSCPSDETFNLSMAGGHSFSLSFEPLCRAASDLSGLFVVITTVLAALYVGRSVGGN